MSTHLSRRAFLKTASVVSFSVAASSLLAGCSMPNLNDLFGPKFKTIEVPEGDFRIALVGYGFDSHCQDARPKFLVENRTSCPVVFGSSYTSGVYTIVPTAKVSDSNAASSNLKVHFEKNTLKTISMQEQKEGDLAICMEGVSAWSSIELTLTMLNGAGAPVGNPVVFTIKG